MKKLCILSILSIFLSSSAFSQHTELDDVFLSSTLTPQEIRARTYQTWLNQIKAPSISNSKGGGAGVLVGVADTGVDLTNPALTNKITQRYNVFNGSTDITDTQGHGTHVSGIIAGTLKDGALLQGVATNAEIAMAKVFANSGYTEARHIDSGINWLVNNAKAPIINLSLGSRGAISLDAMKNGINKGTLFTVAAGNDGLSSVSYPARYAKEKWANGQIIVVGAVDRNNKLASFSNYGADVANWFVVAPGVNIASTYKSLPGCSPCYAHMSGTSMAAPMVAGQAALIKGYWNFLSAKDIASIIFKTATRLGRATDRTPDRVYGWGLINVEKSLQPISGLTSVGSSGKNINLATSTLKTTTGTVGTKSLTMMGTDIFGRGFEIDLAKSVNSPSSNAIHLSDLFNSVAQQDALIERVQNNYRFAIAYTNNSNNKLIPTSFSLSQTLPKGNSFAVGSGGMSSRFIGLESSGMTPLSLFSSNKFNAPYFDMVKGASHMGYGITVSPSTKLKVTTLMETPIFSYKNGAPLDSSEFANRMLASTELEHRTDKTVSIISLGMMRENKAMLGGVSKEAFALSNNPQTMFVSLSGGYYVNSKVTLVGMTSYGKTNGFTNNNGLVSEVTPTRTWSYSLGMAARNLWRAEDKLGVTFSMPTKVISGGMQLTGAVSQNEDGSLNMGSKFLNLTPTATEHNFEVTYTTPLTKLSKLTGALMLRQNPGHDANAPKDFLFGVHFKKTF
jgi:hypothetical protein